MIEWLKANYPTLIICILLAAVVAAIIIKMIYNKKHNISSCSSCGSCPMAGNCGKKTVKSKAEDKSELDSKK